MARTSIYKSLRAYRIFQILGGLVALGFGGYMTYLGIISSGPMYYIAALLIIMAAMGLLAVTPKSLAHPTIAQ